MLSVCCVAVGVDGRRFGPGTLVAIVVLGDLGVGGALKLAHSAVDGLVGAVGMLLDDDVVETDQPRLHRAVDGLAAGLGLTVDIRQVRFDPGDAVTEAAQRLLDNRRQVFGHHAAAIGVRIGVEQDLHGFLAVAGPPGTACTKC